MPPEQRVVRIPVPVRLIREMDDVILAGVGGYETRAEFIVDAIQERLVELTVASAEDIALQSTRRPMRRNVAQQIDIAADEVVAGAHSVHTSMTMLSAPKGGYAVRPSDDLSRPQSRSLFGLHNRDYPSLWALAKLAALTVEEPISFDEYNKKVLHDAWGFGELLVAIEAHTGTKCSALFPTNPEKRKPAETGFRSFAVGDYRMEGGTFITSGPLFEWRVIGLTSGGAEPPYVGVTHAGWELLERVMDVSVEEPHSVASGRAFLDHLGRHAPQDWRGFLEVMRAVGPKGATRQKVLEHVAEAWPEWTTNEVSTNAAGYVARAREWGLIEAKQIKSQYRLTPLGNERVIGDRSDN